MEGSINGGSPIAGWLIMANPIKMDDLGGIPILGNLHIPLCPCFRSFLGECYCNHNQSLIAGL